MELQPETLIATLTAREGCEDALLERIASLVTPTGEEPGAVEYQVHRGAPGTREIVVYERYADAAALEAHLASPAVTSVLAGCAPLLAREPELRRCARVAGFPRAVTVDGVQASVHVVPLGPARLVLATTDRGGVLACGAVDPAPLGRLGIPAARVRPTRGPSIADAADLLAGEVREANEAAAERGVIPGLSGREALRRL